MILLIDNYDSFTYNLYHYIIQAGGIEAEIRRNDQITIQQIKQLNPKALIISPGPCTPDKAGICLNIIAKFKESLPILGVCLGHQVIGQAFGGKIIKTKPMHGRVSDIYHHNQGIFKALPSPFKATRYHSLTIQKETIPNCLKVTATTKDGTVIMGVQHKDYNIHGVQFHPESIVSQYGLQIIKNFLNNI